MRIRGEIKCFYFFNLEPKDIYIYIYNKSIYIINLYKEYIYIYINQGFIQAHLSTAVFPQRFSFFTVCLVR